MEAEPEMPSHTCIKNNIPTNLWACGYCNNIEGINWEADRVNRKA